MICRDGLSCNNVECLVKKECILRDEEAMEPILQVIDSYIVEANRRMEAMRVEKRPHLKRERAIEAFVEITFAREALAQAHLEAVDTGDRWEVTKDLAVDTLRLMYS
jgi:hypothetical protein